MSALELSGWKSNTICDVQGSPRCSVIFPLPLKLAPVAGVLAARPVETAQSARLSVIATIAAGRTNNFTRRR
jgi:hypothetical protein